jgi:hypothetical protein
MIIYLHILELLRFQSFEVRSNGFAELLAVPYMSLSLFLKVIGQPFLWQERHSGNTVSISKALSN